MNFLKSAVASIAAQGSAFPYTFSDRVELDSSIFALFDGETKAGSKRCSIFTFDISANRSRIDLAKNALRKSKRLRHPGLVKVLDTLEVGAERSIDHGMDGGLLDNKVDRLSDLHCH